MATRQRNGNTNGEVNGKRRWGTGGVRERVRADGSTSWQVITDATERQSWARLCETCGKRYWTDRPVPRTCTKKHADGTTCGGRIGEKHRERHQVVQTFADKTAALNALDDMRADKRRKRLVVPDNCTLSAYLLDVWLPFVESHGKIRRTTLAGYQSDCREHWCQGSLAGMKLQDIETVDIENELAELLHHGRKTGNGGGPLSERTVRRLGHTLGVAFVRAVKEKRIGTNPMVGAEYPDHNDPTTRPVRRERVKAWTPEELAAFVDLVEADAGKTIPFADVYCLLGRTGMRISEVLGLRWRDVDADFHGVTVNGALTVLNRKPVWHDAPKSARGRRHLKVGEPVAAMLKRRQAQQKADKRWSKGAWGKDRASHLPSDFVFTDPAGNPLARATVCMAFVRLTRKHGFPEASVHTVRHSYGSMLAADGHPIHAIAARLGHSPAVFAKTYAHALPDDDEALARAGDERLARTGA